MAVFQVNVSKGKASVEVNTDDLPEEVYAECIRLGIQALVNKFPGSSKLTKDGFKSEAEYHAEAMAKATEQVAAMKAGTVKLGRTKKAAGASGKVMTEARRLARNVVKDEMKRQGIKVSHVEASEITKAANALITSDPWFVAKATENLEQGEKIEVKGKDELIKSLPISDKKVKAAEKRKAEQKAPGTSAAKAGNVQQRAKGQPIPPKGQGQHATH
jgi:hypothetical protein